MRARALHTYTTRAQTRRRATVATALAAVIAGGIQAASADTYTFGCVLSGGQEVVPTGSPAIGGGQFLIDTDANTMTYHIAFVGLGGVETAAHIHGPADPGVNAGVLDGLPGGNPKTGVWNFPEALQGDILAGKTYVNIHTNIFPGGEVRGQITPLNASLDGAQEVPPVATGGTGWGVFSVNPVTNQLAFYIAVGGLTGVETAAHIHGTALHGSNAGVVFGLPLGSPKVGVWNYPEALEESIVNGMCYVNVHTNVFPGGEVRGQVVPIVAPIDGRQEVPANGSPGAGIALIGIDRTNDTLGFDVRFAGLGGAETAAHIHGYAPPGSNAGVVFGLPPGNRKLGVWNYGAAAEPQVLAGLTYINIHSTVLPGGEIRGQLRGFPVPFASDVAELSTPARLGQARMAPNPLRGDGVIQFELSQSAPVRVALFDSQGRLVRDLGEREYAAGPQAVRWDGRDGDGRVVASGVYHYVVRTPEGRISRPVSLIR